MTIGSATTKLLILLLAVSLTACVSPTSPQKRGSGRYEMANDSPVLEPIDFSAIPAVTPGPVERTMAGNKSPYEVNGKTYYVLPTEIGYEETGYASWYGRKFHGHLTSNGEIYDMFSYSAAHKSLPIPGFLEVTNLDNGKQLVVRVNDRGPFHEDRIVDLSYAAAAYLGYADKGTARVRIRSLPPETPASLTESSDFDAMQEQFIQERALIEEGAGQEYLQVAAFSNLESARKLLAQLTAYTSLPAFIRSDEDVQSGSYLHRVRLGPVNETIDLQRLINIIIDAGLGTPFRVRQ